MHGYAKGLLLGLTHEIKISEIHAQLRLCRNRESEMCKRICAYVLKTRYGTTLVDTNEPRQFNGIMSLHSRGGIAPR